MIGGVAWSLLALALLLPAALRGDEAANEAKAERGPIGQFLTVTAPVDDAMLGRVSRVALALQARAIQEGRRGVLVLELKPGISPFHQVHGLAKFLSSDVPNLTTVAWIPETVRGAQGVIALACNEIVMAGDAELGDLGMGKGMDADERALVLALVNRKQNRKLSEALAIGMLDPQAELIWVQLETPDKAGVVETRVVLPAEFDRLLRAKAVIPRQETIKSPGTPGVFSGEKARAYDVLAVHTADTRDGVAELYRLPREALRESVAPGDKTRAVIIKLNDVLEPILEQFVLRQIERSVSSGVNLIIFEVDSPGGYVHVSMSLATEIAKLESRGVRAVAYIPQTAISGAAMAAMGADEVYMHPEAKIGNAIPIELNAKDGRFARAPEKVLSILVPFMRELGQKKRRPPALLEMMVDKSVKVFRATNQETGQVTYLSDAELHASDGKWVKGEQLPESGRELALFVSGERAHELLLAERPVANFEELKARLGLEAASVVPVAERTWVDTLIFVLNRSDVTMLLFIVGLMCVYLELHFPTGMFAIGSGVCFALFFWSRFLGGTAGWLEVVLFVLGATFLALEIFVIPGFGVFGVSGALLVLFSLILATQTFIVPATQEDFESLAGIVGTLMGTILAVGILAAVFSRFLPSMPFFEGMVLTPPGSDGPGSEPRLNPNLLTSGSGRDGGTVHSLVGKIGTTQTILRPSGKAMVGEDLLDVVSDGPYIPAGVSVKVVSVAGNRVVVSQV